MEERKICRFCLIDKDFIEYRDIFSDVPSNFVVEVHNCLLLQVAQNDGLSAFACLDCIQKINLFDSFKTMCCNSYQYLIESKESQLDGKIDNTGSNDNDNNSDDNYTLISTKLRKRRKKAVWEPPNGDVLAIIGSNIYKCDICPKSFDAIADYHEHQNDHNGEMVFSCDKCEMIFDQRALLVEHDYKHQIACDICNMKVLPSSLRAHQLMHTDTYKCSTCNSRHTSKASLEKHIQARHTQQKGFVCHICGKQNSCQSSMNRHMAYHSSERPYKCKHCDFTAKSLNIVQVHTSRKHFAEKCVCEICAKIFKSQPSLIQHMKRIHSNKRHPCSVCGKEFIEKYNLNKHMKKHIGQRLHECKICQKEFFTVRKLKEHMHSHKEGCVSCPKCGKEFFYKKYFSKHVLKCNKEIKTDLFA
ncbi:Zinc-finger associated domain (zf-AD) [Popillia japonica]|uniref:Zinc-finger associated domain (Zf-AD) n=1 Tax=Popillia japonica TaxID=7064 RepID=A0AAW1KQ77_POPJA